MMMMMTDCTSSFHFRALHAIKIVTVTDLTNSSQKLLSQSCSKRLCQNYLKIWKY